MDKLFNNYQLGKLIFTLLCKTIIENCMGKSLLESLIGNNFSKPKYVTPELETLECDTFNPDCLIRISNVDTFNILLNPLFFEL